MKTKKPIAYKKGDTVKMGKKVYRVAHVGKLKTKKQKPMPIVSPVAAFKVRIDQLENNFDDIVKDLKERKLTKAEYTEIEKYLYELAVAMHDEAQQL